jgi:hypothetical protein
VQRSNVSALALLVLAGCSGNATSALLLPGDASSPSKDAAAPGKDAATSDSTSVSHTDAANTDAAITDAAPGPRVYVRIKAVQTPYGTGGGSQETPTDQRVGILGVSLLKAAGDTSPQVVIDRATPIDTPYNGGSSTLIGSIAASALVAGTYAIVRVPIAYVNFTVAGTLHYDGMATGGDFNDLIALTSGTLLDGSARARGWYSTSFSIAGMTYGATTGEDSAIAQPGPSSHIGLDLSGAVAAYVFPLTLVIPPHITEDMEIVFTANTYEDFHWMDETDPGYTTDVFDVSATSYEPVTQLGANSATVTLKPVTTP